MIETEQLFLYLLLCFYVLEVSDYFCSLFKLG